MASAEVMFSSCYDEKHPPSNIFTANQKEYFSSTGMYPQEICIQFKTVRQVRKVSIVSLGIQSIEIATCQNDSVVSFEKQAQDDNVKQGSPYQNINLDLKKAPQCKVLKIVVHRGYEDFFTISSVNIQ